MKSLKPHSPCLFKRLYTSTYMDKNKINLIIIVLTVLLFIFTGQLVRDKVFTEDQAIKTITVNSDSTDPAVPFDLSLIVRVLAETPLLEINVQVGKDSTYPAERFFDQDVKVQIQLPGGLRLQDGSLTWQADLKGNELGEFQAKIKAVQDMEGAIDVLATGRRAMGGGMDADTERFYVLVRGKNITISVNPFTSRELSGPGTDKKTE
ncbi:MAG: hypothetical protein AB1861_11365 [Cyanobacteriota bacterium]